MPTIPKTGITRRGFMRIGSGTVLAAGVLSSAAGSDNALPNESLHGKIALEEHFDFAATASASYAAPGSPEFRRQIQDLGSGRIAEMDRGGVDVCILSLVGPGIQSITNPRQANEVARQANDHLAENIAKNPKRLKGFAALALQDPQSAAQELTRCIKELGFCARSSMDSHNLDRPIRLASMTCRNIGIFGQLSSNSTCRSTYTPAQLCPRTNQPIKDTRG